MTSWSNQDIRIDGTSVKSFAFGVALVGAVDSLPGRRGENQEIAYWRGRRWQAKQWEPTTRTLMMWVDGRTADGTFPAPGPPQVAQRNANVRTLMALFAKEDGLLTVERDVLLPTGTETWVGRAEVVGDTQFEGHDEFPELAAVSVDLDFVDPFWYAPSQSASVGKGASVTVTNPGEVAAIIDTVTFHGPLSQPVLLNGTYDPDVWLKIGTDIATDDSVTVTWETSAVVRESDGASIVGALINSGAREWMKLRRGANTLTVTANSGTGQAVIAYRPPRL